MIDWPAAGPVGDGERAEELLRAVRDHVLDGRVDVGDVEGDVVAGPVGVLREVGSLVRRRVVEELDVRAAPAAHHRDLVDHRLRVDVEQVLDAGERPERQRRNAAHHVLEPGDRLVDVGNGDADVVHPDEAELAVRVSVRARARCGGRRGGGGEDGGRGGHGRDDRERGEHTTHPSPRPSLPVRHGQT